jgi:hypothetical protein
MTYAQDCNIGNEDSTHFTFEPPQGVIAFVGNILLGVKFNLNNSGTLHSINLLGKNTGAQVQMAVYEDNNGTPGNLVVSSNTATIGNGIISLPTPATQLIAGDYWVMAVYDTDGDHTFLTDSAVGNVVYYNFLNFGNAIPNNASNFASYSSNEDITYFLEISCNLTGVTSHEYTNEINIYPNPAAEYIQIKNIKDVIKAEVFELNGRSVINNLTLKNNEEINVRSLNKGIYVIKIVTEKMTITQKFLKN